MPGFEAAIEALRLLLPRLRTDWPGSKWEWDDRLNCALSTVAKASEAEARSKVTGVLPSVWSADTLGQAPALIKQICARTGGLLPGQAAFSVELPEGVFAYALWWPWGSGANVSVRLGASHETAMPTVRAAVDLG